MLFRTELFRRSLSGTAGVGAVMAAVALRGDIETGDHAIATAIAAAFALLLVKPSRADATTDRGEHAHVLALAFPLLVCSQIASVEPAAKLLVSAAVLAAVATAFFILDRDEAMSWRSFAHAALLLAIVRFIPVSHAHAGDAIVFAGGVALLAALALSGQSPATAAAAALVVTSVAVGEPLRAAPFPLLLAAVIFAAQVRRWWVTAAVFALALTLGKWSLPIALLSVTWFRWRARGRAFVAVPFVSRVAAATPMLALAPSIVFSALRAPVTPVVAAALLIAVSLVVTRPYLSLVYFVSAAVFLAAMTRDRRVDLVLVAVAVVMLLMSPWSGIVPSTLAMPPGAAIAAAIGLTLTAAVIARPMVTGWIAAAAFVFVILQPRAIPAGGGSHEPIGAGESISVGFTGAAREAVVTVMATNAAALDARQRLGTIEWVDSRGRGYRRALTAADAADWAAFREATVFASKNPLPRYPAGAISGRGREAYIRGSGDVPIRALAPIRGVRVAADAALPAGTHLVVERVDGR